MKNYAKVGNRKGRPAYRTPSSYVGKMDGKTKNLNSEKYAKKK